MHQFDSYLWKTMAGPGHWITDRVQERLGDAKFALQIYVREGRKYFPCFYPLEWTSARADKVKNLITTYARHGPPDFRNRFATDLTAIVTGSHGWGLSHSLHHRLPSPEDKDINLQVFPAVVCLAAAAGVFAETIKLKPERPTPDQLFVQRVEEALSGTEAIGVAIELVSIWKLIGRGDDDDDDALAKWLHDCLYKIEMRQKLPRPKLPNHLKVSSFLCSFGHFGSPAGELPEISVQGIVVSTGQPQAEASELFDDFEAICKSTISPSLLAFDVLRQSHQPESRIDRAFTHWQAGVVGIATADIGRVRRATRMVEQELERIAVKSPATDVEVAKALLFATAMTNVEILERGDVIALSVATDTRSGRNRSALDILVEHLQPALRRLAQLQVVWASGAIVHISAFSGLGRKKSDRFTEALRQIAREGVMGIAHDNSKQLWLIYYKVAPHFRDLKNIDLQMLVDRSVQIVQTRP